MKKLFTVLGGAALLLLGVAAPASAHVEPTVEEAPAGGYTTFGLVIPHGCDGEGGDTVKVEVQMPDGVETATAGYLPGWEATVDGSDPVVVSWEGGPLPHDQFQEFGVSVLLPDTPDETALFPTIQTCASGEEIAWIEETPEGGEEPEHPAPAIALVESEGDHHDGGEEETTDATVAADEHGEVAAAADNGSSDEDANDGLAALALILGTLGFVAGGYALISVSRAS
jgi:uncharacterized protein YcnI